MLNKTIKEDLFKSMREKDTLKKGVLQLLKARFDRIEKENEVVIEEDFVLALQAELKQTKASISEAKKFNREDIVELEEKKVAILESYLPEMLGEAEILAILEANNASPFDNIGKLMGIVMKDNKGKVDGNLVREVILEKFAVVKPFKGE